MDSTLVESTVPVRRYGLPKSQQPEEQSPAPSLSFGSSALFGGMTAKDFTTQENQQEEGEEEPELTLEEIKKRWLNKAKPEHTEHTEHTIAETETQPIQQENADASKNTMDMLPQEEDSVPTLAVEQAEEEENDEEMESDDDIVTHKKRTHHVMQDEEEEEEEEVEGLAEIQDKEEIPAKQRKMSKKAQKETDKEARRMERGLELAPEARTEAKASVKSFLDMFEKPAPTNASSDEDHQTTPSTSPPSAKTNKVVGDQARANLITPRRLVSFMKSKGETTTAENDESDDDDLEIVPSTKAASTSKAMHKLAQLANVNPFEKKKKESPAATAAATGMGQKSFMEQLANKQREQAARDRDERIAQFKARGGQIKTSDEKNHEDDIYETLLEREQRKAEEIRRREAENDEDDEDDEDFVADEEEADNDEDEEGVEPEEDVNEFEDVLATPEKPKQLGLEENEQEEEGEEEPEFIESSQSETQKVGRDEFDLPDSTQLSQFPNPTQSPEPEADKHEYEQSGDVEMQEDSDEEEDRVKTRRHLFKEPAKPPPKPKYNKKTSAARGVVDEEAVESDDEWAGVGGGAGGDDEEDEEGYNLENLVDDNSGEKAVEVENQNLYQEKELVRDGELVNKLMEDVTNGGWRRRKAANGGVFDLSDDEEDDEESLERQRARREQQKKMRLLEDATISNLAANPKAKAFIDCIADKSAKLQSIVEQDDQQKVMSAKDVRESLSFLDDGDDDEVVTQTIVESSSVEDTVEEERSSTLTNIKAIDRISARRTSMKARLDDPDPLGAVVGPRRSVASMAAKFKTEQGTKGVQVLRSLSGPAFGGSSAGSASKQPSLKRTLKPIPTKRSMIPKSTSNKSLFRQGEWD